MTRSFFLSLSLLTLTLGGCVRERLRPVHTVRSQGEDLLSCDSVEVFRAPDDAWGTDPMTEGESYLAQGCGRTAWFQCSPAFSRGTCTQLPLGPYVSPGQAEPHAILSMEVRSQRIGGAGLREMMVLGEDGWIFRRGGLGTAPIPVRAGEIEIGWGAQPMRIETRQHSRISTYNGVSYLEYYTTQRRVADEGCQTSFRLAPRAGATYRLELDYRGPGQCSVACIQETAVGGRVVQSTCEGFEES